MEVGKKIDDDRESVSYVVWTRTPPGRAGESSNER